MDCPNCGADLFDGADFCPHCRTWISHASRRRLPLWIVVTAIGLVLLIFILWVF